MKCQMYKFVLGDFADMCTAPKFRRLSYNNNIIINGCLLTQYIQLQVGGNCILSTLAETNGRLKNQLKSAYSSFLIKVLLILYRQ